MIPTTDYYPFGMLQPGRQYNPNESRFGFQGYLKDNEIAGQGNSYTTYFRQYDPRLGRWKSTDVVTIPWESFYAAFSNNPVYYTDPLGAQSEGPGDEEKAKEAEDKRERTKQGEVEEGETYKGGRGQDFVYSEELGWVYKPKNRQSSGDKNLAVNTKESIQLPKFFTAERDQLRQSSLKDFEIRNFTAGWRFQYPLDATSIMLEVPLVDYPNYLRYAGSTLNWLGFGVTVYNKSTKKGNLNVKDYTDIGVGSIGLYPHPVIWIFTGTYFLQDVTFQNLMPSKQEIWHNQNKSHTELNPTTGCLIEGTKILMADFTFNNIEDIEVGDTVKTFDFISKTLKNTEVLDIASPVNKRLVSIKFSSGDSIISTFDHPIYLQNKGWSSLLPKLTERRYGVKSNKIEVGDTCQMFGANGNIKSGTIIDFDTILLTVKTFTFPKLSEGSNNFIAEGIIVHFGGNVRKQKNINPK